MQVAVFSTFAAKKSEPLAAMLGRVHEAFIVAGMGEPVVSFTLTDMHQITDPAILAAAGGVKRVSAIDRVLKKTPDLARFRREGPSPQGPFGPSRNLTNLREEGDIEPVDFQTLVEIAAGVPRSYPFQRAHFHFSAPGFSEGDPPIWPTDARTIGMLLRAGVDRSAGQPISPGVTVQDSWWVNGRQRTLGAMRVVEAPDGAKALPAPPRKVAAVLAILGKPRKTVQVPVTAPPPDQRLGALVSDLKSTETGRKILAVLRDHRARLGQLAESLPHDIPATIEGGEGFPPSPSGGTGPKKPELDRCFVPLGYSCKGETGMFNLRRRSAHNLTVELNLDVGTWSRSLSAIYGVSGLIAGQGFRVAMALPPSRHAPRGEVHGVETVGQFAIGGADRWRQLVENLAALVAELDQTFVPEVEAAAGPTPAWYEPRG